MQKQIELLRDRTSLANTTSWWERNVQGKQRGEFNAQEFSGEYKVNPYDDWISFYPLVVKSIQEIEDEWEKHNEAIKKNEDYYSEYGSTIMDYMRSIVVSVDDTKEAMRGLGNVRLSDFISEIAKANNEFATGEINATIYARKLKDLVTQMNDSNVLNSVIANLDKYIPDEKVREQVNNIINELIRLDDAFNMTSAQQVHYWNQVRIDGMKEGWAKQKAQIDESERYEIEQHGKTQEQIDLIQRKYDQQREKARKSFNDKAKNDAEKLGRDILAAEKQLNSLRVQNMRQGLQRQLMELETERKEKIEEARKRGKKVGEIEVELNKLYEKKILDAKKKWAYDMQKAYTDMWNHIYSINHTWQQRIFDTNIEQARKHLEEQKKIARELIDTNSVAYGSMGGITPVQSTLRADMSVKNVDGINDEEAKQYLALMEKVRKARVDLDEVLRDSDEFLVASRKKAFEMALEDAANYVEQMGRTFDEYDESVAVQQLIDENYTTDLTVQFELRLKSNQNYYKEIERLSKEYEDAVLKNEREKLDENFNNEMRTITNAYAEQDKAMKDNLEKGLITQEQYNEAYERLIKERVENESSLFERHAIDIENLQISHNNRIQDINSTFHTNTINDLNDFYSRLTSEDAAYIMSPMGFINPVATKKRNDELIRHYSNLVDQISIEMDRLREEFSANKITFEVFEQAKRELTSLKTSVESSVESIIEDNKNLFNDSMSQIAGMVSQFGQTLSSLISSIGDYQDQQYQNQIDQLEEFIDKYDEKLSELDDVISEHTSNVNSIESELSKARGDRRQALIDQLNAEKLAQREALANQKKMEKEKEALEKKKEAVEKERNKKQQQISLTTAIINGSVAFTNALATQPIWLGIALAAMTAAMTAVQVATIKSQKYADGGVLQGKSHRQGGIKVLGGQAEVEGKEFITNKVTTQKNVELLYYINSKKKKLSLEDFIDFYSDGKKVSTNVKNIGNKYASGGQLPQIRTDVNINDRLLEAFEAYSNRNVVVSVVDIMDKTQSVNEVRVLAGLES